MVANYAKTPELLNSVGKRLRAWRKSSSMRLVDVSKMIRVSQGSLSDLENDKALPSAGTLTNLCLYSNLNLKWLLTGQEEMTTSSSNNNFEETKEKGFFVYRLDPEQKTLIDGVLGSYESGDTERRAHLSGLISGANS